MKKPASVVCMIAFAWHIGAQPSFAAGYGWYYLKNRPLDDSNDRDAALGTGSTIAVVAGYITYQETGP